MYVYNTNDDTQTKEVNKSTTTHTHKTKTKRNNDATPTHTHTARFKATHKFEQMRHDEESDKRFFTERNQLSHPYRCRETHLFETRR